MNQALVQRRSQHPSVADPLTASSLTVPLGSAPARRGFFSQIWRKRWLVGIGIAVGLVVASISSKYLPTRYESQSVLYLERIDPAPGFVATQANDTGTDYIVSQAALVESQAVLKNVIERLGAQRVQAISSATDPIRALRKVLEVKAGTRDGLITISAQTSDPSDASIVVNTVVESYLDYVEHAAQSPAAKLHSDLVSEQQEYEQVAHQRFRELDEYQQKVREASLTEDEASVLSDRMSRLNDAVTAGELAVVAAQAEYQSLKLIAQNPKQLTRPDLILGSEPMRRARESNTEWLHIRQQHDRASDELAKLRRSATDEHPSVQLLLKRMAAFNKELTEIDAKIIDAEVVNAKRRLDAAVAKLNDIRNSFDRAKDSITQVRASQSRYTLLNKQWERAQRQVDRLTERIDTAHGIELASGRVRLEVIEIAAPSEQPISPHPPSLFTLWGVVGLAAGLTCAFIAATLDKSVRCASDIGELSTTVVGTVPEYAPSATPEQRGGQMALQPMSAASEAFRAIRTAICFGVPDGRNRVILVTSAKRNEGRSTLVSNLGTSLAQANRRTLVIDTDFRKPIQHELFGLPNECGLSDVLTGTSSAEQAISTTDIDLLDLLPSGAWRVGPAELLGSATFTNLIKQMLDRYDHIIVDGPPVLPVADARVIAAVSEVCIMSLRIGSSDRTYTEQAIRSLQMVGVNNVALVLNGVRSLDPLTESMNLAEQRAIAQHLPSDD